MKKLLLTIVLTLSAVVVSNPSSAHAADPLYNVIGVGDSVGKIVFPYVAVGTPKWLNGEPSRAPFLAGVPPSRTCGATTCSDSAVTGSMVDVLEDFVWAVKPGGFVIIQDAGWGDKNGTYVTLASWQAFVEQTVALIPNNVTLVFVYPGYDPVVSQGSQDVMYSRTIAAKTILEAHDEQPYITVNWWYAVETHDQNSATPYTDSGGLHPSVAGRNWLAQQLTDAVT